MTDTNDDKISVTTIINGFSIDDEAQETSNENNLSQDIKINNDEATNIAEKEVDPIRSNSPSLELHYHPGAYSDILNPEYMRYVNVKLGGMRFLSGVRSLIYVGEDEPPRRIIAWSCCAEKLKNGLGCKIKKSVSVPRRYHPGKFSCFCHECKFEINGFETNRCNEPCYAPNIRSPNTYSMIHKNWEKDDEEIEFVSLQTFSSVFFKTPWSKRSDGIRNWFEWTCCGLPSRGADGCQELESNPA